jgi:hypothetical protein
MTTKVFVSHSAKSDEHKQILKAFVDELSGHGLAPWVDYAGIDVGDPWSEEITQELHQCQAAVVLFSERALQSEFVKYEVSCLAYRKRTQPGFGLYPVIIDETAVERVTDGFFGAIRFGDYQIGKLDEKRTTILDKLLALDPNLTTPTSAIEGQLYRWFSQIAPEVIRQVAEGLDWEVWVDVPIPDAEALHFVRRLLSESLEVQIRALNRIKHALPKAIDEIFNLIAPCWVDEEAALQLDAVRCQAPGKRCAIINGSETGFTCEQFLKRAHPIEDSGILDLSKQGELDINGVTGQGGSLLQGGGQVIGGAKPSGRGGTRDLVVQIRRALCQRLNIQPGATHQSTDDLIDKELRFFEKAGRPPVDVLKLNTLQLAQLSGLADHFKRMTFVALTGETVPNLPQDLAQRAQVIEPLLEYDDAKVRHNEQYAYSWWARRKNLLGLGGG